ncbi:probable AMD2 - amidase [Ustilago trichophora]|uniref:amidase n=1 Tax=Ustilago trichophora TaxID=86804 RepID=A0A5C3DQN7_9BASI|nr:probable AMD2 - amidase [Ustilago trichophora]
MPAAVASSTVTPSNGTSKMSSSSSWKQVAAANQQSRLDLIPSDWRLSSSILEGVNEKSGSDVRSIPASCGILTAEELKITDAPVAEILSKLQSRTWTSEAVTTAFCKRAAIAHQLTNCLTEIFFDEAISAAKKYDQQYESSGKHAGPLAGLPISLKDNFNLTGKDSNLGFVAWINSPSDHDSMLVTLLREQGAVLYCKTATPTAMMIAETVSNANGRALNPFNTKMTPGGSSGGESALLAMRGSPLGVGTDIGGSIRIPCSFTGLWGLKPSFGRFPTGKCKSGLAGQEAVMSINGPMCNDAEGLEIYAKMVVDTEPWHVDPKCVPIPWTPVAASSLPKSLTILMLTNNGLVTPTPPLQRALAHAASKLRAAGHNVIEWDASANPSDAALFERGLNFIVSFFRAEGGATIHSLMESSGEHSEWVPGLAETDPSTNKTVKELWTVQAARTGWAAEMLERMRAITGGKPFDALVSPVAAEVSTRHDAYHHIFYTGVWNLMDMPAVVFPLQGVSVDKVLDQKDEGFKPKQGGEEEKVWAQYDAADAHGLPVCLQVVGHRLREEKTIAVARQLHADCV